MSESVNTGLPENWAQGQIKDLVAIRNGYAFKSKDFNTVDGVPVIRQTNLSSRVVNFNNPKFLPYVFLDEFESYKINKGDVLIGLSGSIGNLSRYTQDEPALQNQRTGLLVEKVPDGIKYVEYYLQLIKKDLLDAAKGVAVQNISSKTIEDWRMPIAPLPQQKHIVAKIEQLFSHIDAGIEALKKAKQLLKQYRQSVLKAAVTGELTKEWREANKDNLEPASQLLERILKERRQKWEEQQLEQFTAKGKMPKDDKWKEKYKPASECDIDYQNAFLSGINLPHGWALCSLDQLSKLITDGDHNPPKRVESGIPHLTARNIVNGELDFTSCTYLTEEGFAQTRNRYDPMPGDVLITCVGTIGRIAIVPENVIFSADRNLAVTRLKVELVLPRYIEFLLNSPGIQNLLLAGSGSTAQPHIYLRQIRALPIPLPTISEQTRIIESVENRTISFNRLLAELEHQLFRADINKQSILASAFSGQLLEESCLSESSASEAHG
ncbi:MAG: restriction endonuclease subunit S [Gammaproteobacteria bacterium]|nr:restriction endonuclease subunit S [Pseudomonadales bacterium]